MSMKTEKIMIRDLGFGKVRQNHKTGFVSLLDVLEIGNEYRRRKGLPERELDKFWERQATQEYLSSLLDRALLDPASFPFLPKELENEKLSLLQEKHNGGKRGLGHKPLNAKKIFTKVCRAKNFIGTNGHMLVTIELARWCNPDLAVEANIAFLNGLLGARDDSGDSHRIMCRALIEEFRLHGPGEAVEILQWLGVEIQKRIFGKYSPGAWESATEDQLKTRITLQKHVSIGAKWAAKGQIPIEVFLTETLAEGT